jgi:hypothetical protein
MPPQPSLAPHAASVQSGRQQLPALHISPALQHSPAHATRLLGQQKSSAGAALVSSWHVLLFPQQPPESSQARAVVSQQKSLDALPSASLKQVCPTPQQSPRSPQNAAVLEQQTSFPALPSLPRLQTPPPLQH